MIAGKSWAKARLIDAKVLPCRFHRAARAESGNAAKSGLRVGGRPKRHGPKHPFPSTVTIWPTTAGSE
jgi:hypothetical protein